MPTFQKVKLGDVVDFIDGDRGTNYPSQGEFFPNGHCLFLNTKNVPNSKFIFEEKMFITKEKDAVLRKGKLQRGDYVLTTRGTVGNFAYYDESTPYANVRINSGMVILRKKTDELDEKFFRYYLSSPSFSGQVKSRATGSAQPQLPIKDMLSMEVVLPDPKIQTRIASVLSAYDDLIENNGKRIKALEQMAQLLYTEWFVKFTVPVEVLTKAGISDGKLKLIDSRTPYGPIPTGWEVKRLREITSVITKGTTPTTLKKSFVENGINFIKIEAIGNNGEIFEDKLAKIDQETHNLLSRSKLQVGDVIFSIAGAIGRTARIISRFLPANTNQALAIIRPKEEVCRIYLYQVISSLNFLNFSKGRIVQTAQANVSLSALASAQILFPNKEILVAYNKKIFSVFEMIDKIRNQNRILEKTRDLLIPQLVTGKRKLK